LVNYQASQKRFTQEALFSEKACWWLNQPQHVACFVSSCTLRGLILRKYICNWKHNGDVSSQNDLVMTFAIQLRPICPYILPDIPMKVVRGSQK